MEGIILTDVGWALAADVGRTSLSYSNQSGRYFKEDRSRTMSPSVGSIKLSSQLGREALPKRIASPVLEMPATEEGSPSEIESPAKEIIPEKQVESEGKRRKGARKSLTVAVIHDDEQPKSRLLTELEDEEDLATANSEPSLGHEDEPYDGAEVDSPAKKKVRRDKKASPAQRGSTGKGKSGVEKGRASSEKPKTPVDRVGKTPVIQRVSQAKITRSAQKTSGK